MASTAEGRALTELHQRQQIAIATAASAEARALWSRLDVDDLDGSTPYWLASNVIAVNRRVAQSQTVATEYLTAYRVAEVGAAGRVLLGSPDRTPDALRLAGPIRIKRLIAGGMDPEEAYERAFTKYAGMVSRQTLMGGRLTIANTTAADRVAVGWRRVTDGNPCAFCALLASRGPVYGKRSAVATDDPVFGDGKRYHAHCGCTAEPVYGTWEPGEREQYFYDSYIAASRRQGSNRNTRNILAEMRRSGGFRDSPSI